MKTPHYPDQHPEDLLDKVRRGQADAEEQRLLQEHLAGCVICAMQVHYASGGALATGETAVEAQLDRMALNRLMLSLDPPSSRWRGWFLARRWAQVAVGVVALSGTAAAAGWWTAHRTVDDVSTRDAAPAAAGRRRVAARAAVAPPLAADVSPAVASVAPEAEPVVVLPRADANGGGTRAVASAAALFERARQLRVDRDWSGARNVYARLQHAYPHSRETQLSYLVLGRMFLDEGRPELAERQFATYLARGGAGAEEALLGLATAFQRMGRLNEEAASFEQLLARHPSSVYASKAQTRLRELRESGVQRSIPGTRPRPGAAR